MNDFLKAAASGRPAVKARHGGQPLTVAGRDKWLMIADKSIRTSPQSGYMVTKARFSKGFTLKLQCRIRTHKGVRASRAGP